MQLARTVYIDLFGFINDLNTIMFIRLGFFADLVFSGYFGIRYFVAGLILLPWFPYLLHTDTIRDDGCGLG